MPLRDPKNQKLLNHFIAEHAPLINLHVTKLRNEGKLSSDIDHDDLHMAGVHGLMDALHRYDPKVGASFSTYAQTRIRGRMLDHITSQSDVPKSVAQQAKNLKTLQSQDPTKK